MLVMESVLMFARVPFYCSVVSYCIMFVILFGILRLSRCFVFR